MYKGTRHICVNNGGGGRCAFRGCNVNMAGAAGCVVDASGMSYVHVFDTWQVQYIAVCSRHVQHVACGTRA
jgi:hypothetical protein